MPLLPACLIEPLWVEFADLIGAGQQPEFSPDHPWGCHRRQVPDRVVFDHVIAALVHGSGYERIASPGCSDRTLRRRLLGWAGAGHGQTLLRLALAAFDQMIGLNLDDLSVDGCWTALRILMSGAVFGHGGCRWILVRDVGGWVGVRRRWHRADVRACEGPPGWLDGVPPGGP